MSRPGCCRTGCTEKATVAPKLNVPAQGWPIDTHQPLTALVAMPLCEGHFQEVATIAGITDALGENLQDLIAAALGASGKAPPDFERAWVTKVSINSDEYKSFVAARAQASKPAGAA